MSVFSSLVQNLVAAGISSPRLEARLLLARVLNCDENDARILNLEALSAAQQENLARLLKRRTVERCPLDKILGVKDFYKYRFTVNENVLSPRPDTEIILEQALRLCHAENCRVLDLGTGSGCLLLSLLKENPSARGVGVDISSQALDVARQNAQNLGVASRVEWCMADWFAPDFEAKVGNGFDIIVSNPPYIPDADISELEPEVREHDPYLALSGGDSGYDSYAKIAEHTPFLLQKGGYILLEAGIGQAQHISALFAARGLQPVAIVPDLAGIDRCVILKK